MRFTTVLAIVAILTPAALIAHRAASPGIANAQTATDLSAAKKKAKKKGDENMKAAPGTGPSGPPATKY